MTVFALVQKHPKLISVAILGQTLSLCTTWHDIRIYIRLDIQEIKNILYAFLLRVIVCEKYRNLKTNLLLLQNEQKVFQAVLIIKANTISTKF